MKIQNKLTYENYRWLNSTVFGLVMHRKRFTLFFFPTSSMITLVSIEATKLDLGHLGFHVTFMLAIFLTCSPIVIFIFYFFVYKTKWDHHSFPNL